MVGITGHRILGAVDVADLIGIDPIAWSTGHAPTLADLQRMARRSASLLHPDRVARLAAPVRFTAVHANALRDFLAGQDNTGLTDDQRLRAFFDNTTDANYRSTWNP